MNINVLDATITVTGSCPELQCCLFVNNLSNHATRYYLLWCHIVCFIEGISSCACYVYNVQLIWYNFAYLGYTEPQQMTKLNGSAQISDTCVTVSRNIIIALVFPESLYHVIHCAKATEEWLDAINTVIQTQQAWCIYNYILQSTSNHIITRVTSHTWLGHSNICVWKHVELVPSYTLLLSLPLFAAFSHSTFIRRQKVKSTPRCYLNDPSRQISKQCKILTCQKAAFSVCSWFT